MASEKESFVFYRSFFEALQDLKDKERLKVYDAICDLALNENDTKLTGIAKIVFTLIRPQILSNTKKYKDGQKGAEYGRLGGRPRKEKTPVGLSQETPNVNENANVNVNENANVNVTANDNVGDSCVDGLQEIIEFYNNNIGLIAPYGVEILSDYLKEMPVDLIILAMQKAVEADKRTIQYIKGILNNWSKKGIKSVIDAEKEDKQFQSTKQENKNASKSYNNYDQRQYSDLNSLYANKGV